MTNIPIPPDVIAAIGALAGVTSFVSEKDWERLLGPFGGLVIAIIVCGIMLRLYISNLKLDRAEKQARHKEMLAALDASQIRADKLTEKLMDLTAEGIKASGKTTVAIASMDRTIQHLTVHLMDRPCQSTLPPMPAPAPREHEATSGIS